MLIDTCKKPSVIVVFILVYLTFGAMVLNAQDITPLDKKTKHHKLESVLERLYEENEKSPEEAKKFAKQRDIRIRDGKVTVFLFSETGNAEDIDKVLLKFHGAGIIKQGDSIMKVEIPIKKLKKIADEVTGISFIKLPDRPVPLIQSQGVTLTGASSYHASGNTGAGIQVGIVDLEFDGLSGAVSAGEIPVGAVYIDCTGSSCVSTSFASETGVHGTAVAEIVHDMAPGAQLYLIKVGDRLDLKDAKDYCIANGIDIVNHSVGWFNQNFYDGTCYDDNPVCTVNSAYSNGILWVNAVGNSSRNHYEALFTDSDGPDPDLGYEIHDELISFFAVEDQPIVMWLTWNAWPVTDQDYDLYLLDSEGYVIDSSQYYQTGTEPPTEQIIGLALYTGQYYIEIDKWSATTNHYFELYGSNLGFSPYVASSSLLGPADATGAFAVGAIDYADWITGPEEYFSSQGPTNDGRMKPEISGPDGVSTLSYGLNLFYGTSASAPHVAGAAALVLSANPEYSISQLWDALTSSAIDMGSPGQDNIYGFGRLNLPAPLTDTQSLITLYYNSILGRAPDAGGLNFWTSEIQRIVDLGIDIKEGFIALGKTFFNSAEYLAFATTDAAYVTDLYETFLQRTPSQAEIDFWATYVAGTSRNIVMNNFVFSTEFDTFMTGLFGLSTTRPEYSLVNDFYRGILGRLPDSSGFNYWLSQMKAAQCAGAQQVTDISYQMLELFVLSAEYTGLGTTNLQYISDLYDAVLRRSGEPAGVTYWVNALNTMTRIQVLQAFTPSAEFQGRVDAVIAAGCLP